MAKRNASANCTQTTRVWIAVFHLEFREDLCGWINTNRKIALRVLALTESVLQDLFSAFSKSERLKHLLAIAWSRRLTAEHHIVYSVSEERIDFLSVRYHY